MDLGECTIAGALTEIGSIRAFGLRNDMLKQTAAEASAGRIRLMVVNQAGETEEVNFDSRVGLRFPHLGRFN